MMEKKKNQIKNGYAGKKQNETIKERLPRYIIGKIENIIVQMVTYLSSLYQYILLDKIDEQSVFFTGGKTLYT